MRVFFLFGTVFCFLITGQVTMAAEREPSLPKPIADLKNEGAQMKYLGRDLGFDAWIAVKDGQEQYFYVTPDGSAFFLGVLFNKNGRVITYDQIKRLRGEENSAIFENLENAPSQKTEETTPPVSTLPFVGSATSSPITSHSVEKGKGDEESLSEQLFQDVRGGYSFTIGRESAPEIYMFVDPLCPHCKKMINNLNPAIQLGHVRVRVLMVGALEPQSYPLARMILGSSDPGATLQALLSGNKKPENISLGTVDGADPRLDGNLAILQKWKFDSTPLTVYRAKDGTVKLLQGTSAEIGLLLKDLP